MFKPLRWQAVGTQFLRMTDWPPVPLANQWMFVDLCWTLGSSSFSESPRKITCLDFSPFGEPYFLVSYLCVCGHVFVCVSFSLCLCVFFMMFVCVLFMVFVCVSFSWCLCVCVFSMVFVCVCFSWCLCVCVFLWCLYVCPVHGVCMCVLFMSCPITVTIRDLLTRF